MIEVWFENYYIVYGLAALCGVGLLIKLFINVIYIRLMKASASMSTSNNKLVRQMKIKFETFYKLKIGVHNVDIFVDKYVYRYKICGMLLSTWENLSGLMLVMCMLIAPISSILGLIIQCGETEILYTFFTGVCTSALLIVVDNLFNIPSKKYIIKINIRDYLENYLKVRLEQEAQNPQMFHQYREEMATSLEKGLTPREMKRDEKRIARERKQQEKIFKKEEGIRKIEEKKRAKIEQKEMALLQKESEKRRVEEERRMKQEERLEQKKRKKDEKEDKRLQKQIEKEQLLEQARIAAEQKVANKRKGISIQPEQNSMDAGEKSNITAQTANVITENAFDYNEEKKKRSDKQSKLQQRNERLKEEIQAQRQIRAKERMEGKDPFDVYFNNKEKNPTATTTTGSKIELETIKPSKKQEESKSMTPSKETVANEQVAATTATYIKEDTAIKGKDLMEDKVIDDILKEFLA